MNINFFSHLEKILATERLDAYRKDGADEITTFSRYLLNMALCESLYSPLQFAEIAMRNAMHAHLSSIFSTDEWYNAIPTGKLLPWQSKQIIKAKDKLHESGKAETPGGIIAELHFGFWTGFFNRRHARTGLGFSLVNNIFPSAPSYERSFTKIDSRWNQIRTLRNRVFHHERILHWTNLDAQHRVLLEVIGWINPELQELTFSPNSATLFFLNSSPVTCELKRGRLMNISSIEIKNVKGIDHKQFNLQLMPNKPNMLVAPNGFGKSSIATAFASMNSKRMTLAEKDHYKENMNHPPELSITFNGQTLIADTNKNEIWQQFDVTVIRSGLIPKATKRNMGRFTQVSASLEIEMIPIRKIPDKAEFNYQVSETRSTFGVNGKVLPNISGLFQNPALYKVILGCNFSKLKLKRIIQETSLTVELINVQSGTANQIGQWINDNLLAKLHAIRPLNELANGLLRFNLATDEADAFLTAYQIAELHKTDSKSFKTAVTWLEYVVEKEHYRCLIDSFCSSNWQWAKLTEDKKKKTLSVSFPKANQLSNGQRDVLTLVIQMHKVLYEGSKKPLILVIDEVFDYLDDANLVAFQYYVSSLIQKYKDREHIVYPLILTHLDPGIFFDFCFNNHQIRTHYLQATSSGKCKNMLKLIEVREKDNTNQSIKEHLDKFWFHFNPSSHEVPEGEWPDTLKGEWHKSEDFHAYAITELDRYLLDKNFDALAVCIAIRVSIEKSVYALLVTDEQKETFITTHKTKEKLNFAASHILDIPETYFLLGLIHNANLHWKQGKDFVSPLVSKLNHPTIKHLIVELIRKRQNAERVKNGSANES